MRAGEWRFSTLHKSVCKIIEIQHLWEQEVAQIWLPAHNIVTRVLGAELETLDSHFDPKTSSAYIEYVSAAAKVAEVMEGFADSSEDPILLAPMESNVIPLPHQMQALSRAISGHQIRYLLADEVGLGKTIEAGLIMRELKLKGLVRRTLVVAPKGIATQWASEMQVHFNEGFQLILGKEIATLDRMARATGQNDNNSAWSMYDQVIVSLDSVKPIDKRRGWSKQQLSDYNHARYENLITAGWDLIIVDETHRLGGSTEQVARYKLGRGLSEASPYLLLLSATPHQGKSDAFHRIMSLLDHQAFPDPESVTHDHVAPYVIRTEKRRAIDEDGRPLFKPRKTQMVAVHWESRHSDQQALYEAVTDYVRVGYNQALKEKKRYIGFLMILMQRLVVSSTSAIRTSLERRLAVLDDTNHQYSKELDLDNDSESAEVIEDLYDMDGQQLLDELLRTQLMGTQQERKEVENLLESARKCERGGLDAKAEALLDWIYKLQIQENEPDLKVLIFTEFIPTQHMLKTFLETRGISVSVLNGSMGMEERKLAQDNFRDHTRVMVSTDAGGEGLNLQFCHVVINYDIPWNPMRLEQRIGRVDRIGQSKIVLALNFMFEDSVEFRVREVLEEKLAVIFDEFGIDKTGDVLDSAQAGELFEDVFAQAILNPEDMENVIDKTVSTIRSEIEHVRENSTLYGISDEPDPTMAKRLRSHPLPYWVERMTVGYINSHGGASEKKSTWWHLTWPEGKKQKKCVFKREEYDKIEGAKLLNLESRQIRALAQKIPQLYDYQRVPVIQLVDLPVGLSGTWGLFEIKIYTTGQGTASLARLPATRRRFISIFISKDGNVYGPTARHIWDSLQSRAPLVTGNLSEAESMNCYKILTEAALESGNSLYLSLKDEHVAAIEDERKRGLKALKSKRKLINRVGLPEVKQFRLDKLNAEMSAWEIELESARQIVPEIKPLLAVQINEMLDE
ncbi:MAG: DEAD/DEAH box helicase family protein [Candidatus Marinimicrobia bacterium]|nr:DEAD/DEAH box helicase family protein [Candidatus Neomarinimicrobiota bacterium]